MKILLTTILLISLIICEIPLIIPLIKLNTVQHNSCEQETLLYMKKKVFDKTVCIQRNVKYFVEMNVNEKKFELQLSLNNPLIIIHSKDQQEEIKKDPISYTIQSQLGGKIEITGQMKTADLHQQEINVSKSIFDLFKDKIQNFNVNYLYGHSTLLINKNSQQSQQQQQQQQSVNATQSLETNNKTKEEINKLEIQDRGFDGVFGLGLYKRDYKLPFENFVNTIVMLQIVKNDVDKTFLVLQQGNLNDYVDLTLTKVESQFDYQNQMALQVSKFAMNNPDKTIKQVIKTNVKMAFSSNSQNIQLTSVMMEYVITNLNQMKQIHCKIQNQKLVCSNIQDLEKFKQHFFEFTFTKEQKLIIEFKHLIQDCFQVQSGRNLQFRKTYHNNNIDKQSWIQSKSKSKFKPVIKYIKKEDSLKDKLKSFNQELKQREKEVKSKEKTEITPNNYNDAENSGQMCLLNVDLQSNKKNSEILIGIPALEGYRVYFDQKNSMMAFGPAIKKENIFEKVAESIDKIFFTSHLNQPQEQTQSVQQDKQFDQQKLEEQKLQEQKKLDELKKQQEQQQQQQEEIVTEDETNSIFYKLFIGLLILMVAYLIIILFCSFYMMLKQKIFQKNEPFKIEQTSHISELELKNPNELTASSGNFQTDIEDMMRKRFQFNDQYGQVNNNEEEEEEEQQQQEKK